MSYNNKDAFAARIARVNARMGEAHIVGGETTHAEEKVGTLEDSVGPQGPWLLTISLLAMTWGAITFAIEGAAVVRIPNSETNPFFYDASVSLTPGLAIVAVLFLFGYFALKIKGLAAVLMFAFGYFFTSVAGYQAALVYPQTASMIYTPEVMNQILVEEGFPADVAMDWSGWSEYAEVSQKYTLVQNTSLK